MQSNWKARHTKALREYLAKGMSYSEIAKAINAKFKTAYSRSAAIGRVKRMGRTSSALPEEQPKLPTGVKVPYLGKQRERYQPLLIRPVPVFERTVSVKLRCIEIAPRHLSLIDLEPGDCRYPYGGDEEGEAISFCGHPRRKGSSYCAPHFHLTRGPGIASERAAGTVSLRLVEAA